MIDIRNANVRSRAPLRIGLAGGGTDLSPYCNLYGGVVLNATIDRFAYAHVSCNNDGALVFRARDMNVEEVLVPSLDISLAEGLVLHRAVYRHMMATYCDGEARPLTISTTIDVPAGSGLGASSALVVALIEAFKTVLRLPLGPYDTAKLAFEIERIHVGLAGGRQDQYAAAFGGFNFIEFLAGDDNNVIVNPLRMRHDHLNELESSLVICFSGQSRRSDLIIKEQVDGLKDMDQRTLDGMHQIKSDAIAMKQALLTGDIRGTAAILERSWIAKKRTANGIATDAINHMLDAALAAGAWGGKVSGAGGGGFLMLLTDPEHRYELIRALNAAGGQASAVKLTFEGVEGWAVP